MSYFFFKIVYSLTKIFHRFYIPKWPTFGPFLIRPFFFIPVSCILKHAQSIERRNVTSTHEYTWVFLSKLLVFSILVSQLMYDSMFIRFYNNNISKYFSFTQSRLWIRKKARVSRVAHLLINCTHLKQCFTQHFACLLLKNTRNSTFISFRHSRMQFAIIIHFYEKCDLKTKSYLLNWKFLLFN